MDLSQSQIFLSSPGRRGPICFCGRSKMHVLSSHIFLWRGHCPSCLPRVLRACRDEVRRATIMSSHPTYSLGTFPTFLFKILESIMYIQLLLIHNVVIAKAMLLCWFSVLHLGPTAPLLHFISFWHEFAFSDFPSLYPLQSANANSCQKEIKCNKGAVG